MVALSVLFLSGESVRIVPFRAPRTMTLGENHQPDALAAGDFDGDGKLDLVVGSGAADDLIVFLGDGKGGFRRGGTFAAGPSPTEIAVADFDRDSHLDLAIANHGTPLVTILLGDGRGSFRPAHGSPLSVNSKPHPHAIAAGDVDGDGLLDLVIDSWSENRFTLLKGDGRGDFAAPGVTIEAGRKPYRNLKLADLDGDGRYDLAAPNTDERGVTILVGDGRGHFRGAENPPTPAGPSPFAIAVADVNRDGKPDLVIANYSGHITDSSGDGLTFLLNEDHGRFRLGPKIPTGRGSGDVAAGDVDGDGYLDAVTVNAGTNDLTIAFGGPDGLSPSRIATVAYGGREAWRILLADFDGDGRADAVTANTGSQSVSILLTR
ncbi:MAG: VCBS repeat-containing protein [Planctomycetes bacterium]|nr:VCBS repeat-containing protein [Planctomycetota bacterium]MBI3845212.1 VCBS repeat-containing protein [Planctomycetota bacterium]